MSLLCNVINLYDIPEPEALTALIEAEHKNRLWEQGKTDAEAQGLEWLPGDEKTPSIITDERLGGFSSTGAKFYFYETGKKEEKKIAALAAFKRLGVFYVNVYQGLENLKKVAAEFKKEVNALPSLSSEQAEALKEFAEIRISSSSTFEGAQVYLDAGVKQSTIDKIIEAAQVKEFPR